MWTFKFFKFNENNFHSLAFENHFLHLSSQKNKSDLGIFITGLLETYLRNQINQYCSLSLENLLWQES